MADASESHQQEVCTCWQDVVTDSGGNNHWLQSQHWAATMFANAPSRESNSARVCDKNGRVIHVMSGDHRVDLTIFKECENGEDYLYMRHMYCVNCKKIVHTYNVKQLPVSPIVWFRCSDH